MDILDALRNFAAQLEFDDYTQIATLVVAAGGVLLGSRIQKGLRADARRKHFAALHAEFWANKSCQKVRRWLACPDAVTEFREIVQRRMECEVINPTEYAEVLEPLDQFFNMMAAVIDLRSTSSPQEKKFVDELILGHWVKCLLCPSDTDQRLGPIKQYVTKFYPTVHTVANSPL